jgi:hypothetical protein
MAIFRGLASPPNVMMQFDIKSLLVLAFAGLVSTANAAAPSELSLSNEHVQATWHFTDKGVADGVLMEKETKEALNLKGDLFSIVMPDGTIQSSSEMSISGTPHLEHLDGNAAASRLAERLPGRQLVAELSSPDGTLHATWRAILRDGSNYLRQQVTLTAGPRQVPLKEIVMLDQAVANARSSGSVDGSPVVTKTMFFGLEHPLSINRGEIGHVRCFLPRGAALAPGEKFGCSVVMGFARPGQMRRDFLTYLERERAHPYRPFLTYNTWYDLGYFAKYDETGLLDRIHAFGEELVTKRHVRMDSFLLDDGWDDSKTLWRPHHGFPNGFGPSAQAAAQYGAALGFWLSPWGGYGKPKEVRIASGRQDGFEIVDGSFSLSGPKYYDRFRSLCADVVDKFGVNQFKFDGLGAAGAKAGGPNANGETAIRDFEAMLRLIAELRAKKPDIYINQTTGTWPSPFWLEYADSIWRGGEDHTFAGSGSDRQQWITYRDSDVYERVVTNSELYPLNSLMLHGIIYAKSADKLNTDPKGDFKSEVRSFFGSGTQLQELYITPSLLTPENWDTLAASARWSRENADTLRDTHWVGGDPLVGHVYGWASWSPRKGILTLRNPSGKTATIDIDAAKVFELPDGAPQNYELVSPYKDQRVSGISLQAGETHPFELQPFEVLVFEAIPKQPAKIARKD